MVWHSDRMDGGLAAQVKDPRLRRLFDHWSELRRDCELPPRRSSDPVQIPSILSAIFICDYDFDTGRLRYRLVGEDIRSCYPQDITGTYMDELFQACDREEHRFRARMVMDTPAIYYARGEIYGFAGRYGTGERLALPLSSSGNAPDGLIGASVYDLGSRFSLQETEERMAVSYWDLDGINQIGGKRTGFRRRIRAAELAFTRP